MTENLGNSPEITTGLKLAELMDSLQEMKLRFPHYFEQEAMEVRGGQQIPTGLDRWSALWNDVKTGFEKLEQGELSRPYRVSLFHGQSIRGAMDAVSRENHRLLEGLFSSLSDMRGQRGKTYTELENEARELHQNHKWVLINVPNRFDIEAFSDGAAVMENGRVSGIQFKLASNLYASVFVANFGHPEAAVDKLSAVDLYIVPERAA